MFPSIHAAQTEAPKFATSPSRLLTDNGSEPLLTQHVLRLLSQRRYRNAVASYRQRHPQGRVEARIRGQAQRSPKGADQDNRIDLVEQQAPPARIVSPPASHPGASRFARWIYHSLHYVDALVQRFHQRRERPRGNE